MTRPTMQQMWDDYRDGTLPPQQRAEFELWLKANEPAASLWQAEGRWLAMLAQEQAEAKPQASSAAEGAFAAAVLARWDEQGGAASPVLARIGWRRWMGVAVSVAAAVVLAATLSMWSSWTAWFGPGGAPSKAGTGAGVAVNEPAPIQPYAPPVAEPDTLGVLFASAGDGYAAAAAQPAKIRQALSDTASMFDVAKLATLLDPDVPDPARFVQPSPQPRG